MIRSFSPFALGQLAEAMGGGAVVNVDFGPVIAAIDRMTAELKVIAHATTNPRWAAGDEMLRQGVRMLDNGWTDDAVTCARDSISSFEYRGAPHLLLGLALLGSDDPQASVDAMAALQRAMKYGSDGEPEIVASATMAACALAQAIGRTDLATELLRTGDRVLDGRCPDITAALALLGVERELNATKLFHLVAADPANTRDLQLAAPLDPPLATIGARAGALALAVGRLMAAIDPVRKHTSSYSSGGWFERVGPPIPTVRFDVIDPEPPSAWRYTAGKHVRRVIADLGLGADDVDTWPSELRVPDESALEVGQQIAEVAEAQISDAAVVVTWLIAVHAFRADEVKRKSRRPVPTVLDREIQRVLPRQKADFIEWRRALGGRSARLEDLAGAARTELDAWQACVAGAGEPPIIRARGQIVGPLAALSPATP